MEPDGASIQQEQAMPRRFNRILRWLVVASFPWIAIIVAGNFYWAPSWFVAIRVFGAVIDICCCIVLFKLLIQSKATKGTRRHRVLRIMSGIVLYLFIALNMLGLIVMQQPCSDPLHEFSMELPSGERTFYVCDAYFGWFVEGRSVWVREGNSPFVRQLGKAVPRTDINMDPEVNGDTVKFFFEDKHIFKSVSDKMLIYNAKDGSAELQDVFLLKWPGQ